MLGLLTASPTPAPQDASAGDRIKQHLNRTDAIPTLLVNHQLHAETMAAIKRLPKRNCYTLDVMLLDEEHYVYSWDPVFLMRTDSLVIRQAFAP